MPVNTVESVVVNGSVMEIFLFQPEGAGRYPGILLAQHLPGHAGLEHDQFTLRTAERFAGNGYCVAVPYLFHWWPKHVDVDTKRNASTDTRTVADLEATYTFLRDREQVAGDRLAIVGHCWGGRVAWLGACHLPGLRAMAMFYGGNIKVARGEDCVPPIAMASRISCPVIGFFGNDDQNPSPLDVDDYSTALSAAGVQYSFHRYASAGHAFQNFATVERYREQQSEDAWNRVLDFLQQHMN